MNDLKIVDGLIEFWRFLKALWKTATTPNEKVTPIPWENVVNAFQGRRNENTKQKKISESFEIPSEIEVAIADDMKLEVKTELEQYILDKIISAGEKKIPISTSYLDIIRYEYKVVGERIIDADRNCVKEYVIPDDIEVQRAKDIIEDPTKKAIEKDFAEKIIEAGENQHYISTKETDKVNYLYEVKLDKNGVEYINVDKKFKSEPYLIPNINDVLRAKEILRIGHTRAELVLANDIVVAGETNKSVPMKKLDYVRHPYKIKIDKDGTPRFHLDKKITMEEFYRKQEQKKALKNKLSGYFKEKGIDTNNQRQTKVKSTGIKL